MQYRKFGNTGVSISALGFGCMRLPEFQTEDGSWQVDQEKTNEMLIRQVIYTSSEKPLPVHFSIDCFDVIAN